MPTVVSFIGHQASGKTTLIVELIPLLAERGYRVGTVKHAPHEKDVDRPGSDSFLHRLAGAKQTLVFSEANCALFWEGSSDEKVEDLVERLFGDYDIVIAEGFKRGPFPKVEVFRRPSSEPRREPLAGEIDVLAVVTDEKVALPDGVERLSSRRPEEIIEFLEAVIL